MNKGDVRVDPLTDKEEVWTGSQWVVLDEPLPQYKGMTFREWLVFRYALRHAKPPLPEQSETPEQDQSPEDKKKRTLLQAKYNRVMSKAYERRGYQHYIIQGKRRKSHVPVGDAPYDAGFFKMRRPSLFVCQLCEDDALYALCVSKKDGDEWLFCDLHYLTYMRFKRLHEADYLYRGTFIPGILVANEDLAEERKERKRQLDWEARQLTKDNRKKGYKEEEDE